MTIHEIWLFSFNIVCPHVSRAGFHWQLKQLAAWETQRYQPHQFGHTQFAAVLINRIQKPEEESL